MLSRFSKQDSREVLEGANFIDNAFIQYLNEGGQSELVVQTFDLSSASINDYKIAFAFKSVYVAKASDTATKIEIKFMSDNISDSYCPLFRKDTIEADRPFNSAFLRWDAQSGKTITLVFFKSGRIKTGSTTSEISSSVDGNSVEVLTDLTIDSTPQVLVPQDLNRKIANLYFNGSVEISDVGQVNWFPLPSGYHKFSNTAEIWVRSSGSVTGKILIER